MPLVAYLGNSTPQDNTEVISLNPGPDGAPRSIVLGGRALLSGTELRAVAANYQVQVIEDIDESDPDKIPTEMPTGYGPDGYPEGESPAAIFGPEDYPDEEDDSSVEVADVSHAPEPPPETPTAPAAVPVTPAVPASSAPAAAAAQTSASTSSDTPPSATPSSVSTPSDPSPASPGVSG